MEGPPLDVKREDQENKEREARWRGMEDTTMHDNTEPTGEREVSQRPSEPVLREQTQPREQTSVEGAITPNVAVASKESSSGLSEQPDSELEAAAATTSKESATKSAAEAGEKEDAGKKDSTQLESRVASEAAAGDVAAE